MSGSSVIREFGVQPDKWLLICPRCGASAGPDIAAITSEPLIRRWRSVGQPRLENPGAGWNIQSAAPVVDLPQWIELSKPSPLELAYLGQQIWPHIEDMLAAMTENRGHGHDAA
jgi:hypothetical protein